MHVGGRAKVRPVRFVDVWREKSERAPGSDAERSGPVVRPNVDELRYDLEGDLARAGTNPVGSRLPLRRSLCVGRREAVMNHSQTGIAQPVTDSVQRAMKFLKDRPMPQPRAQTRHNTVR